MRRGRFKVKILIEISPLDPRQLLPADERCRRRAFYDHIPRDGCLFVRPTMVVTRYITVSEEIS